MLEMEGKNQKKGNDSRLIAPQDPQERWDKGAAQRSDCTAVSLPRVRSAKQY